MSTENKECCTCMARREHMNKHYADAKFDMFFMTANINRIISSQPYIILTWRGENCCGCDEEGHNDPKLYTVHNKNTYLTVHHVIRALIDEGFEVPCEFRCLVDIVPLIHPVNSLDSAIVFELSMRHPESPCLC